MRLYLAKINLVQNQLAEGANIQFINSKHVRKSEENI